MMIDNYLVDEPETPEQPSAPAQAPVLQAAQSLFQTDEGQQWSKDAAIRVQDYLNTRAVAQANTALGQEFVQNLDSFKNNLGEMVRGDPQSVNMALDLVPDTVRSLVASHPNLPDEARQGAHDELLQSIQGHIAREAVMGLGDIHEGAARSLLNSDRISALLNPDETQALNGYIDGMQLARGIDTQAQQAAQAQATQTSRDNQTLGYMGALSNKTGDLQLQPGWAQRVMKDPLLPPEYTAPMLYLYNRLAQNGDAAETNPMVAEQLIRQVAQGQANMTDVLGHAGGALRLPDALTIAGMLRPQNEGQKGEAGAMVATMDAARRAIVGADGENGAAGERAYQRFVQWLLPQYRMAGQQSLNPNSENWIFRGDAGGDDGFGGIIRAFTPKGDELLGNPLPHNYPTLGDYTQDRPSLADIFSRQDAGKNPTTLRTMNEDQILYRRPNFRIPRREVQDDNLGQPGNSMQNNNPQRNI